MPKPNLNPDTMKREETVKDGLPQKPPNRKPYNPTLYTKPLNRKTSLVKPLLELTRRRSFMVTLTRITLIVLDTLSNKRHNHTLVKATVVLAITITMMTMVPANNDKTRLATVLTRLLRKIVITSMTILTVLLKRIMIIKVSVKMITLAQTITSTINIVAIARKIVDRNSKTHKSF